MKNKVQIGLFGLVTIGNQPGQHVDKTIDRAVMPGVFDLRNILELINNALDNGPFSM